MYEKMSPLSQIAVHVSFVTGALIAHKLKWVHVKRSAAGIGRALIGR